MVTDSLSCPADKSGGLGSMACSRHATVSTPLNIHDRRRGHHSDGQQLSNRGAPRSNTYADARESAFEAAAARWSSCIIQAGRR